MATYSAVSASEKDADSVVDVSLIDKLDQNPHAIAEGASGAPKVQSAAINDNAITAAKIASSAVGQSEIASGAVHQSELDTSIGTVSTNSEVTVHLTLPGGQYGFYPQVRVTDSDEAISAHVASNYSSTSFTTVIAMLNSDPDFSANDVEARQRYINSSPPIDLGDGDIPLFFFAHVDDSGKILSSYSADVPPWLYNGPTTTTPDRVLKNGKKLQWKRTIDPHTKRVTKEMVELTQDVKNADMNLIPHPFASAPPGSNIILLDPPDTAELLDLHESCESVHKLIKDDYLRIDNKELNRCRPNGVMSVGFKWRNAR